MIDAPMLFVATSLALLVFGRGMHPDYAVLGFLFAFLLSVVIMAADSYGARKRV